jgi:fengycin family lipopeptide synthetase A
MKHNLYYTLSHPQKRIWYSEMMHPNTSLGNLAGSVVLRSVTVDLELLNKAINLVIERRAALRIRLIEASGYDVRQYISDYTEKNFEIIEGEQLEAWMLEQSRGPFSLIDSDLFYFALIRFPENKYGYYFKYHHIICDAMSVALLNKEIYSVYINLVNNRNAPPDSDKPSFEEFLERDRLYLTREQYSEDKAFWLGEFKDMPEPYPLYGKASLNTIESDRRVFSLGEDLTANINNFCRENHTTIFRFFMSAFYMYFSRVTSCRDIVIGTGHHNRVSKREREMIGMTVSTLPVRISADSDMDFATLLKYVTDKITNCLSHQCYPYESLATDLRERGYEPGGLLNIMLNHIPSLTEDYVVERYTPGADPGLLNIKLNPNQLPQQCPLEIAIDYRVEAFEAMDIERLFRRLEVLIKDIINSPFKRLFEFEIMPVEEKHCILKEFNNSFEKHDGNMCFHQCFSEQALKTPDNTALVFKDKAYTYRQLDNRTNQLAKILRLKGVGPETRIVIMAERSADFVIGLLAVLKAGAVYVPVDPSSPQERIDFILTDSGAELLLSQKALREKAMNFNGQWLDLSDEALYAESDGRINNVNKPTDSAYIIYTSGSSGNPKGVVVEHRNLLNFCLWHKKFYELTESDAQAAFCNFIFDVSIGELLPPLMAGASVHIIPEEIRLSPYEVNRYFEKEMITAATFPTRVGEIFTEVTENRTLRVLTLAGERLNKYRLSRYKLVNAYGPTEATIYSTAAVVEQYSEIIPIGKPVLNTGVYVVDPQGRLLPIGVPGELWLSGAQITRGYLNRPQLTSERFIHNPFSEGEQDTIAYKTGDLVRWLPDGNLDFLGRMDGQVKIRGYRVELSEIEYKLLQHPGIKEAVVLDYVSHNGSSMIQASIVSDRQLDAEELKRQLRLKLPDYMIPEQVVTVPSIPLTQTGKVDKEALRLITSNLLSDMQSTIALPGSLTEQKLAAMWKELFQLEQISITKSFFNLGGNSLLAIRLFVMIKEVFQLSLPVSIIFKENTIERLSKVIDDRKVKDECLVVCIREGKGNRPLFCIHDFSGEVLAYSNLAGAMQDDEAVYGIRYPFGNHKQVKSLEALASGYIKEIKYLQPKGPYRIAGYSSGGIIAYETARQLLEQKEEVSLLALLDTPNYNLYPFVINSIFAAVLRYALSWLMELSLKDKLRFIEVNMRNLALGAYSKLLKAERTDHSIFDPQKSMQRLLAGYVPKYYRGKLILFRAKKRIAEMDQMLGWNGLVKEIELHETGGNHVSVINRENSNRIAEILKNTAERTAFYDDHNETGKY